LKPSPTARLLLFALPALTGCVTVAPWQRARLASPRMEQGAEVTSLSGAYREKVLESKAGGGLPGAAPGGGCGCTQ
jgi:Domain of unknown function (DUF4266)